MKTRLVLSAITIWTALIAAYDVYLAVMLANGPVEQIHGGWPSNLAGWVLEHYKSILYVKVAASAIIAIWWLAAAVKLTSRPWLRLANAAFSGWLLIQVVMVSIVVGTILLQSAGLQHEPTGRNLLSIIRVTDLSWLIVMTLCVPGIQGVLGEWACGVGRFQSRESDPTVAAEAA